MDEKDIDALVFISSVKDYTPFVNVWNEPSGGLHDFLIHFLNENQDIAFQHIGVWTVEQFLEGGGKATTHIQNAQKLTELDLHRRYPYI